jgi:hypothetical protein
LTRASLNRSITFGAGIYSFAETGQQVDSDSMRVWEIALPALPADNTGTIVVNGGAVVTLTTGHNILDGDTVDAYWDDAGTAKHRYGLSAARVVNAITLTDGADAGGDALQDGKTVTLCKQLVIDDLAITGDNVEWLALVYSNADTPTARASLDMHDAGGSEFQEDMVHQAALGGCANVYNVEKGDANPIDGDDIVEGYASHNAPTAGKLYILALIDSTA